MSLYLLQKKIKKKKIGICSESDPEPEADPDPDQFSRKPIRIRIKMKLIRNTEKNIRKVYFPHIFARARMVIVHIYFYKVLFDLCETITENQFVV